MLGPEAPGHVVEADPAEDGHAVPAPVAVVRRLVAERGERRRGEGRVGQLGLLQAQDVRLGRTSIHSSTRGRRAFSELTFQVAMRTGVPVSARSRSSASTMTKSRSASQASSPPTVARPVPLPARADSRPERHLELEHVAGDHLATEPGPVDAAEQGQLAGEPVVGQHGDAAELGQRLDHEHPGQGRAAGEVPGEEGLVAGELPPPPGRLAGLDGIQLGDEEKRVPVRQIVLGSHDRRGYRP